MLEKLANKCKKCGELLSVNFEIVLESYPPKYEAMCEKCGHSTYLLCNEAIKLENLDVKDLLFVKLNEFDNKQLLEVLEVISKSVDDFCIIKYELSKNVKKELKNRNFKVKFMEIYDYDFKHNKFIDKSLEKYTFISW